MLTTLAQVEERRHENPKVTGANPVSVSNSKYEDWKYID